LLPSAGVAGSGIQRAKARVIQIAAADRAAFFIAANVADEVRRIGSAISTFPVTKAQI
jgi:hypothetical protein